MPPKKRKVVSAAERMSAPPTKKVRMGETSTIDDGSRASTPAGRPRRSTSNDAPQYNFTRTRQTTAATNTADKSITANATASSPQGTTAPKRRGRPPKNPLPQAEEPAATTTTRRGILKNGEDATNKRPTTRPNVKAPGGSTASAAKRRSSEIAQPTSPTAKKSPVTTTVKRGRGRPSKKQETRGRPSKKKQSAKDSDMTVVNLASEVNESRNEDEAVEEDIQYWLMKAEPDSRIEKGIDVKFSIDDLAANTEPEGWDGVRNPAARNNMRAMRVGDLAFFYHSNCKVPGVAGVMRIVEEHSIDMSAFDPDHPYYDAKSDRDNPKWELVKVEFVKKFDELVTLRELRSFAGEGGALENMQMLRQGRLSVSSVQPAEWRFILDCADEPHSIGQPDRADGYESETDGETEGQLDGGVKTDGESGGEPGSSFDYPPGGTIVIGEELNGYLPSSDQEQEFQVQAGDHYDGDRIDTVHGMAV